VDRAGTYLALTAVLAVALALLLAAFNFVVDPYGAFDPPRMRGVNELPLGLNVRPMVARALALGRVRPADLVLGNSRAERGYDPRHAGFAERPAYNAGIGGAGIGEVRRYFFEALATGGLRRVLLALDLEMFQPSLLASQRIPDVAMLTDASGAPAPAGRRPLRLAFALLSGATTSDSWWSLRHQRERVAVYLPSGLREGSYDESQVEREGGPRGASLRSEAAFFSVSFRDAHTPGFRAGYEAALAQLADIVAASARAGVRLDLVLNPVHAWHSYVYEDAGLWPLYEQWKRDLVAMVARSPGVALWDFSGVSECTSDPVPAAADPAAKMRWYRESGHFRPALGDVVLDHVYGRPQSACPGLGRRLDAGTIAAMLAEQRTALARWKERHPGDVSELDELARQYGRGRAGT